MVTNTLFLLRYCVSAEHNIEGTSDGGAKQGPERDHVVYINTFDKEGKIASETGLGPHRPFRLLDMTCNGNES